MSKTKIIIGLVLVVLVGAGVYFFVNPDMQKQVMEVSPESQTGVQAVIPDLTQDYQDTTHNFSFKYPTGWNVSLFQDESFGADVVTVTNEEETLGVQMIITPFDEPISVLTVERIKQDQPDLVIRDPQEVVLGNSGKGVAFLDAEGSGANRQVWFIARGFLYQITTPINTDTLLQDILNSWKFE